MCVSGGKKYSFFGKFDVLFSWNTRFEIRLFALLPAIFNICVAHQLYLVHWRNWKYQFPLAIFLGIRGRFLYNLIIKMHHFNFVLWCVFFLCYTHWILVENFLPCTVFSRMSDMDTLPDKNRTIIEQFVIRMYDKTYPVNNINQYRRILYMRSRRAIEGIPPTHNSLIQHIKQAMLQSR